MATERSEPEGTRPSARLLATTALAVALLTGAPNEPSRQLQPVQNLPSDVAAVVEATWDRFSAAFAGRLDCMGPVEIELVREVPDGDAVYRPLERRILVEIPTSPRRFSESLAHELGHHLEATCADQVRLRPEFLNAQGFAGTASWGGGEAWHLVPAEHFAEAVVHLVNGDRVLHDDQITLSEEALHVVREWGAGGR
jgi:hypothetical protein